LMELPTTASIACGSSQIGGELCVSHGQGIDTCLPRVHRPSVHAFRHQTNGSHGDRFQIVDSTDRFHPRQPGRPVTCKSRISPVPRASSRVSSRSVRHLAHRQRHGVHPIGVDRLHVDRFPVRCSVYAWNSPLSAVIWCTRRSLRRVSAVAATL
jgi:hypothetical protein